MLFIGVGYVEKFVVKVFVCLMCVVLWFMFEDFFVIKWIKIIESFGLISVVLKIWKLICKVYYDSF